MIDMYTLTSALIPSSDNHASISVSFSLIFVFSSDVHALIYFESCSSLSRISYINVSRLFLAVNKAINSRSCASKLDNLNKFNDWIHFQNRSRIISDENTTDLSLRKFLMKNYSRKDQITLEGAKIQGLLRVICFRDSSAICPEFCRRSISYGGCEEMGIYQHVGVSPSGDDLISSRICGIFREPRGRCRVISNFRGM